VVEQALQAGLSALVPLKLAPYRLQSHALGQPRSAFDFVKTRAHADTLKDEAIGKKQAPRRWSS
jgi:hypothetical protein